VLACEFSPTVAKFRRHASWDPPTSVSALNIEAAIISSIDSSPKSTDIPACPVTGRPAIRRVQWVSTRLLIDLWRIAVKTDARSSFGELTQFGLWESPTGLYFFHPPRDGDRVFYSQFYAWLKKRQLYSDDTVRQEFLIAANRVPVGARLLDVGSGTGNFSRCVPGANYTGLDPHFAEGAKVAGVRNETLAEHLVEHTAFYDVVCCFQVIEHVRDPVSLFADIMRAVKPGGLVCVGAPHVPSAFTRLPNFLVNAPPHHLTWWTRQALSELATNAGAVVESIEATPWGQSEAMAYWMARFSPVKCSEVHYRGAMSWHIATLVGYVTGAIAFRLFGVPKKSNDEGASLLLFARRPRRSG
jgi:SAM-dependent methyltransferase